MSFTPIARALPPPPPPRNKGGRPKDSFVDELLEVVDHGVKLSRSPQRCRFCDKTYATRNCGRAKRHAAYVCPHIPFALRDKARDELARKKPPKKLERRIDPPPPPPPPQQQQQQQRFHVVAGEEGFWSPAPPHASYEFHKLEEYWKHLGPPLGLPGPLGAGRRCSESPEPPPPTERLEHEIEAEAADRMLPPIRVINNSGTKLTLVEEVANLDHPLIVRMAAEVDAELARDCGEGIPERRPSSSLERDDTAKPPAPVLNFPGPPDVSDEKAPEDSRDRVPIAVHDLNPEDGDYLMTSETETRDQEHTRPNGRDTIDTDESRKSSLQEEGVR